MDYKEKHIKNEKDDLINESFKERNLINQKKRKNELKTKLVLFNVALALVIIMVILVVKLNGLNKSDNSISDKNNVAAATNVPDESDDSKNDDNGNKSKAKDKKNDSNKQDTADTMAVTGQKRWLRDDLDPKKPMVALTFDDGPYTPVTGKILNILKKYDAKATFFVVGSRVPQYEDMVKKAYEQGNEIATHTYNHADLTKLSTKKIKAEINKSSDVINDAIGCSFSVLRPPAGNINDKMRKVIKVPMIYWSVDTEDWRSRNAKSVLKECKSIRDGDIVLMHDLYPSTAEAVKKLVPRLVKEGYQLVTVDEMLYYKGIDAKAGKVYASGR